MYYYDDTEVDQSQSGLVQAPCINDRAHFIAYKLKAVVTDLLHRALSLSNTKSILYGEVGDRDVKVLIYSLPSKLIMNTAKLFGDSIRGTIEEDNIVDIVAYSLYIYSIVSGDDYKNIDPVINHIHKLIQQRHYEYNSVDLVYDRLSTPDIASMVHVKALRIKNLLNVIDKVSGDTDSERVKYSIKDSIYDIMIYVSMVFLKMHRV
jgi:hypothetical protein